jgi:hypothetical protein
MEGESLSTVGARTRIEGQDESTALNWDFKIARLCIWGGRGIGRSPMAMIDTTLPPPWESLEGVLEADDGREYAWEVVTLKAYLDPGWLDGNAPPPYRTFPELGRPDILLSETRVPMIIVDAPSFGPELLDFLQSSDPRLRSEWLYPLPSDDELE